MFDLSASASPFVVYEPPTSVSIPVVLSKLAPRPNALMSAVNVSMVSFSSIAS